MVLGGYWDGSTILVPSLREGVHRGIYDAKLYFSDGMRKQFLILVDEGHYGEIKIAARSRRTYDVNEIRRFYGDTPLEWLQS